ncbi:MAG TPA: VOC family protein [Conexibacter sp.]|jgi:catechol 2,3-dioxygenase-like lactoylglutathione lyase family enzyme
MRALHHIGITISNLEDGLAFYHDILGLPIASPPSPVFDDPELGVAVGVPGGALRQVNLRLGDDVLELIEYTRPGSPVDRPLPQHAIGAQHVAFRVEDAEAEKARLEALGVVFFGPVNVVDEGVLAGWRWVYFSDMDGNALELVEIAYERTEETAESVQAYLAARAGAAVEG